MVRDIKLYMMPGFGWGPKITNKFSSSAQSSEKYIEMEIVTFNNIWRIYQFPLYRKLLLLRSCQLIM